MSEQSIGCAFLPLGGRHDQPPQQGAQRPVDQQPRHRQPPDVRLQQAKQP